MGALHNRFKLLPNVLPRFLEKDKEKHSSKAENYEQLTLRTRLFRNI
jgi:hypothetical protein